MHHIDKLVQKVYGFSDDDILREFEAARAEVEAEGRAVDMAGFDRLWRRLTETDQEQVEYRGHGKSSRR